MHTPPLPFRTIACAALTIAAGIVAPRIAAAQSDSAPGARAASCLDTVSMATATSRIVYLYATMPSPNAIDPRLGERVDEFAQAVAQRMRRSLSARRDTLPAGEPGITWRAIYPRIVLVATVRRNGEPTFRLLTPHVLTAQRDSAAADLVLRAAVEAQREGDGFFWPGDLAGDSVHVGLAFAIAPEGTAKPSDVDRAAFPVFSVRMPHDAPARPLPSKGSPVYPVIARDLQAEGVVVVGFVVDTTGRVDPQTIQERWPASQQRLVGKQGIAYDAFLASVTKWLLSARFTPAKVGGCPVRQRVEHPFTFNFAR